MSFFKRFSPKSPKSPRATRTPESDIPEARRNMLDQRQYFLFCNWQFICINVYGHKCHTFRGSDADEVDTTISVFVESVIKSYIRKNRNNEQLVRKTLERIVDEQVYETEIKQTSSITTLSFDSKEFKNVLEQLIQNLISAIDKYVRLQKNYNFNSSDLAFSITFDILEPIQPQDSSLRRKKSEKRRQTT